MGNGGTRARFDRRGGRYTKGLSLLAFGIHEETSAMSGGDFPTELVTGVGVRLVAPTGGVEGKW